MQDVSISLIKCHEEKAFSVSISMFPLPSLDLHMKTHLSLEKDVFLLIKLCESHDGGKNFE